MPTITPRPLRNEQVARMLWDEHRNAHPTPLPNWIKVGNTVADAYRAQAQRLIQYILEWDEFDLNTPEANSQAAAPYDSEAIFARVQAVRRERTEQYRSSRISAHRELGVIWSGILDAWLRREFDKAEPPSMYSVACEIPPIPGSVVSLLLAAMKIHRCTFAPDRLDSYEDAMNYSAIAEENAHEEGEL